MKQPIPRIARRKLSTAFGSTGRAAVRLLLIFAMGTLFLMASSSSPIGQNQEAPTVLGTAKSEEEFQAYQDLIKEQIPEEAARKAEAFLKQYPDSGLNAYVRQGAVLAYEQLNNREKVVQHGEEVLKDLPENVAVLAILARTYAEGNQPAKAIARAESALQAFGHLPRPNAISEAEWSAQRGEVEAGIRLSLGTAQLTNAIKAAADQRPQMIKDALANLHVSLDNDPQSDLSSYRLGLAYLVADDRENASKYLAWAVSTGGRLASTARTKLEQVYQTPDKDRAQSIERLIAKAREDLQAKVREKQDAKSSTSQ